MPPDATPVLRAAFEATGSGGWIMSTLIERGLDRANGFRLDLGLGDDRMQGGLQATEARLAAGAVDVIDTDWLSIARCRRQGLAISAVAPYGAIFGGLVARDGGPIGALADLPGHRLGVVRPDDKNWLLLRAACRRRLDFDPETRCTRVDAGSKTRLQQLLAAGEVDAALVYWHQVPALTVAGEFEEICDLLDLLPDLGTTVFPSTFFVVKDALLAEQPELARGFGRAAAAAIAALRDDPAAWRCAAGAGEATADALRDKWLARIGLPWQAGMADELDQLANQLAGQALPAGTLATEFLQGDKS